MKQLLKYLSFAMAVSVLLASCTKGSTEFPSTNIEVNSAEAVYNGKSFDGDGNEYDRYEVVLTLGSSEGYEMKTAGAIIVLELNTERGTGGKLIPGKLAYAPVKEGNSMTYTFNKGRGASPSEGSGSFLGIKDSEFAPMEFAPIRNGLIYIGNETGEYSLEGIIDTGEQAFTFSFLGSMSFKSAD